MSKSGVLLMAHGTPSSMDEMPEYLRLVRGGRPPSPELVAEMRHNYEAIGGRSPLTDLTMRQAAALRERLGPDIPVAVGMRNWTPSIAKYFAAAAAALAEGMELIRVDSFYLHPRLLQAFAERVQAVRPGPGDEVVFTAHSLPKRVVDEGDSYVDEVAATARGVAALAGVEQFQIAYQSAGRTPEPWIGPDVSDFIRERAAAGARSFVVAPIGFVCDHTEILFDIDVQAKAAADAAGASLRRPESLNTSPPFIAMLEDLVRTHL